MSSVKKDRRKLKSGPGLTDSARLPTHVDRTLKGRVWTHCGTLELESSADWVRSPQSGSECEAQTEFSPAGRQELESGVRQCGWSLEYVNAVGLEYGCVVV